MKYLSVTKNRRFIGVIGGLASSLASVTIFILMIVYLNGQSGTLSDFWLNFIDVITYPLIVIYLVGLVVALTLGWALPNIGRMFLSAFIYSGASSSMASFGIIFLGFAVHALIRILGVICMLMLPIIPAYSNWSKE